MSTTNQIILAVAYTANKAEYKRAWQAQLERHFIDSIYTVSQKNVHFCLSALCQISTNFLINFGR